MVTYYNDRAGFARGHEVGQGQIAPNRAIKPRSLPPKSITAPTEKPLRTGRWTADEKILFLHGLKVFGRGRWKKIRQFLPTRSLVQIKSHAQKVLKREEGGEDIFAPLEMMVYKKKLAELLRDNSQLYNLSQPKSLPAKRVSLSKESKGSTVRQSKKSDELAAAALCDLAMAFARPAQTTTSASTYPDQHLSIVSP